MDEWGSITLHRINRKTKGSGSQRFRVPGSGYQHLHLLCWYTGSQRAPHGMERYPCDRPALARLHRRKLGTKPRKCSIRPAFHVKRLSSKVANATHKLLSIRVLCPQRPPLGQPVFGFAVVTRCLPRLFNRLADIPATLGSFYLPGLETSELSPDKKRLVFALGWLWTGCWESVVTGHRLSGDA